MKTVFLIGEHHDYPAGKRFIAKNSSFLKKCGFDTLFLEGVEPDTIPKMEKHPSDKNDTLGSYQEMYLGCKSEQITMKVSEDWECRFLIDTNKLHPAMFNQQRESVFVQNILNQEGNSIFLTGDAHIESVSKTLQKSGCKVLIVLTGPGILDENDVLIKKAKKYPNTLHVSDEIEISKNLDEIIINKVTEFLSPIMSNMRANPGQALPNLTKKLQGFYNHIICLEEGLNSDAHDMVAKLEYTLGSLYDREENINDAIKYTELCLERRQSHSLDGVERAENKLTNLLSTVGNSPVI